MQKFENESIYFELRKMQGWNFINGYIEKNFVFINFKDAMTAMIRIGFEAENMNHHPEWMNVFNKLNIRLRTDDAKGITEKDFSLARKIDEIVNSINRH
jgi:4a-hydroxytetrahydrobiopterin dehydratase